MKIARRTIPAILGAAVLIGLAPLGAMAAGEDAVAKKLEAFRAAQVAMDAKAFDTLTAPELTYSHSNGNVEDKAAFIKNSLAGNKFTKLEYRNPQIRVVGDAATVRFNWVGEQVTKEDKPVNTNLHILMVWQKQGGDWKLLARGATKL